MRMTSKSIAFVLAGIATTGVVVARGALFGSTTVTPLGWTTATVSTDAGTGIYINDGHTQLPSALSVFVYQNALQSALGVGASLNADGTGTATSAAANVTGSFYLKTTETAPSLSTWTMFGDVIASATASGRVIVAGSTAESGGYGSLVKVTKNATIPKQTQVSPRGASAGGSSYGKKKSFPLSNLTWYQSDGGWATFASVGMGHMGGGAGVTTPGIGGDNLAVVAQAGGGTAFTPTGAKPGHGTGIVTINIPHGP